MLGHCKMIFEADGGQNCDQFIQVQQINYNDTVKS
jgi:hypothetical protein